MSSLGTYSLETSIEHTSLGETFIATRDGETFEVELLYAHVGTDAQFVAMLLDDIRTTHRLVRHPNVARVLDIVREGERVGIVKERVDGPSLRELVKRRLPIELAVVIGAEVAAGLTAIHAADAVHRKLNHHNVRCTRAGDVRITELGLARAEQRTVTTASGVIRGVYDYMSPEQVLGRHLDGRSDVFSLGSLLYSLLTSQPAFRGDGDFDTIQRIRDIRCVPLGDRAAGIPTELAALVHGCLVPVARRPTADVVERQLRAFLSAFAPATGRASLAAYLAAT